MEQKNSQAQAKTEEQKETVAKWKFKYRNYQEITDAIDANAQVTPSGVRPHKSIRARNWFLVLDLNDPEDRKINEALEKSPNCGVFFNRVRDLDRKSDTIADRAQALGKLIDMSDSELLGMLSPEDLKRVGLESGATHMQLVMAVIDCKHLEAK